MPESDVCEMICSLLVSGLESVCKRRDRGVMKGGLNGVSEVR